MHDKILYINGDSYSADIDNFSVYDKFVAEKLNLNYINKAIPGSSNARIFRDTLEDCIKLKNQNITPYVILGVSFVTREEVWRDDVNTDLIDEFNKGTQGKFITLDFLKKDQLSTEDLYKIIDNNINTQMVHFYTELYMLINTFENLNIPYFIFSAADNQDFRRLNWTYLKSLEIFKSILQNKNVLDFHGFNIPLWAKENNVPTTDTGHLLGAKEHKLFAEYLLNNHLLSFNWNK
jgi:hypothetical protein